MSEQQGAAPTTAVAEKEKPRTISGYLEKFKGQIAMALPSHITPDRMIRLVLTQINSNKQLKECTPESLFASVILAAQMGLEVGIQGQGYLIPYGNKATFVPGWQGIVDLVARAGRATVWTGAAFEGDYFDWQLGDSPYVKHRPGDEDNPNKITHTYAVGRVRDSEHPIIEVWSKGKLEKHRDQFNKVGTKHYSYKSWEMYARKVPLLQVCKYLPKSVELSQALMAEAGAETGRALVIDGSSVVLEDGDQGAGGGEEKAPTSARERAAEAAGRTGGPAGNTRHSDPGAPEQREAGSEG